MIKPVYKYLMWCQTRVTAQGMAGRLSPEHLSQLLDPVFRPFSPKDGKGTAPVPLKSPDKN